MTILHLLLSSLGNWGLERIEQVYKSRRYIFWTLLITYTQRVHRRTSIEAALHYQPSVSSSRQLADTNTKDWKGGGGDTPDTEKTGNYMIEYNKQRLGW